MIDLEKMREEVEYFVSAGLQTGVASEDVIELLDHIAQLQEEIQEQCRVNGMGAEREAGLLSKVSRLEKDAARYRWLLRQSWFQCAIDRFDPDDGGMQDRFELECDRIIDAALQPQGATK